MEPSPERRLPEAYSLPDGFVEISAELPRPANPVEVSDDRPGGHSDGSSGLQPAADARLDGGISCLERLDATTSDSLVEKAMEAASDRDYKEIEVLPHAVSCCADGIEESKSSERVTEGYLERHAVNLKESHADRNIKSINQKQESVEVKRKAGKQNSKSEKELLELTLKFEKVVAERDAAVAVRDRLESLCRELQHRNKMLMEECQRVSTEGQNMRLDLSKKFNDAIKDVSSKLEEQKHDCLSQLKENEMLRNKLKHLADQYERSEQQFAQKVKQKTLELQLADLKMQQQQEKSSQEQTQMQAYVEQVTQLMETERSLRLQLAADGEKFQQFQDALTKSNEVFETFKQEMEKMAKLMKELKKENEFLKSKCEKSDIAIVKLVEEREHTKKQLEKAKNRKEKLESLCRALQSERKQSFGGSNNSDSASVQAIVDSATELHKSS